MLPGRILARILEKSFFLGGIPQRVEISRWDSCRDTRREFFPGRILPGKWATSSGSRRESRRDPGKIPVPILQGIIIAAGGEVTEEENTEDVLEESETVDVNAGDDFSDNDANNGRLEAGEDVNCCNDEVLAGFDEKLSMDLVVIVTTVGLPLDDVIGVINCETVLFTAVGVSNTDENVTCDVAPIAGNDDVS